jgi:Flp pilus assembly protein TadD
VWVTRVALWTDAAEKAPGNWRAHSNLGQAHNERGERDAAIQEYRLALQCIGKDDPGNEAFVLSNLGASLLDAGRLQEAVTPLRRALERDPTYTNAVANLAVVMLKLQDLGSAEAYATRGLALDPGHATLLQVVGAVRLARGDPEGALRYFDRAVRADPDDGEAWFSLGVAQATVGQLGNACAAWRQVLQIPVAPELRERALRTAAAASCPGF